MTIENSNLGQEIRTAVSSLALNENEVINNVKVIIVVEAKNVIANITYRKGAKGFRIDNYNSDTESLIQEF